MDQQSTHLSRGPRDPGGGVCVTCRETDGQTDSQHWALGAQDHITSPARAESGTGMFFLFFPKGDRFPVYRLAGSEGEGEKSFPARTLWVFSIVPAVLPVGTELPTGLFDNGHVITAHGHCSLT